MSEKNEYEVEKIIKDKMVAEKQYFYVKWKGFPVSANSWEPKENLAGCSRLLNLYVANKNRRNVAVSKVKATKTNVASPMRERATILNGGTTTAERRRTRALGSLKRADSVDVGTGTDCIVEANAKSQMLQSLEQPNVVTGNDESLLQSTVQKETNIVASDTSLPLCSCGSSLNGSMPESEPCVPSCNAKFSTKVNEERAIIPAVRTATKPILIIEDSDEEFLLKKIALEGGDCVQMRKSRRKKPQKRKPKSGKESVTLECGDLESENASQTTNRTAATSNCEEPVPLKTDALENENSSIIAEPKLCFSMYQKDGKAAKVLVEGRGKEPYFLVHFPNLNAIKRIPQSLADRYYSQAVIEYYRRRLDQPAFKKRRSSLQ